ncbi:MAG: tyrosine-type recombinase/integrase [Defluviitaleaceae bacterium]|nr:tyrosine-type recombinase/integrase [Defluviitaleaceae bacterium]
MTLTQAFDLFILDQRLRGNTDKTIKGYQGFIRLFVEYLAAHGVELLASLELQHVQQYQLHLDTRKCENKLQPLTRRTVRTYMKHIRIFLVFCYAEGYLTEPLHLKMKIPRAEKPFIEILTDEEAERLLNACGTHALGRRDYAIVSLMLDCGLRLSEVAGITIRGITEIYVKVTGKGRKERIVPIGTKVREALNAYMQVRPHSQYKQLFLSVHETPLTTSGIVQMLKRLKHRTEIWRLHAHFLRHTFATNFLLHDLGDIYELSRILGHADIKTTEGYLQVASYYKLLTNRTRQTYLDKKATSPPSCV